MRFSQRIGMQSIKTALEKEDLSTELRNSLWTLILELIINARSNLKSNGESHSDLSKYFRGLWINFYKWPIDDLPSSSGVVDNRFATQIIREWFFKTDWYLVLDFIEFSAKFNPNFAKTCNNFFEREFSAYRFVDENIVEINSKEEILEIETAIKNSDKFSPVKTHLKTALNMLADRKNPDYRNSIKESISAVESLAKLITNNNKATLGQSLKEIESKHDIPGSLKAAFSSLYGYTSDESGIRHALIESDVNVGIQEARFMLIACSAFINYLISKL